MDLLSSFKHYANRLVRWLLFALCAISYLYIHELDFRDSCRQDQQCVSQHLNGENSYDYRHQATY